MPALLSSAAALICTSIEKPSLWPLLWCTGMHSTLRRHAFSGQSSSLVSVFLHRLSWHSENQWEPSLGDPHLGDEVRGVWEIWSRHLLRFPLLNYRGFKGSASSFSMFCRPCQFHVDLLFCLFLHVVSNVNDAEVFSDVSWIFIISPLGSCTAITVLRIFS